MCVGPYAEMMSGSPQNSAQDINRRPMLIICSQSPFTATDSARPLTNRQTPRLGSTVRGRQQIGNSTAKDGHR